MQGEDDRGPLNPAAALEVSRLRRQQRVSDTSSAAGPRSPLSPLDHVQQVREQRGGRPTRTRRRRRQDHSLRTNPRWVDSDPRPRRPAVRAAAPRRCKRI